MKKSRIVSLSMYMGLSLMILALSCQSVTETQDEGPLGGENSEGEEYNEVLAKRLGADDYGMHKYVIALLKKGPIRDQDSVTAAQIQRAHMDNISRLAEEGKLVLAGPFLEGSGDLQGLFVFDVPTVDEARELTASDPAVKAGRLVMDLLPWYGSAALMQIPETHKQIARINP